MSLCKRRTTSLAMILDFSGHKDEKIYFRHYYFSRQLKEHLYPALPRKIYLGRRLNVKGFKESPLLVGDFAKVG